MYAFWYYFVKFLYLGWKIWIKSILYLVKKCGIKNKNIISKLLNLPYDTANGWNGKDKPFSLWLDSWFFNFYENRKNSIELKNLKNVLKKIKKI